MDRILLDTLVTGLPMVPAFMGIYVVLRIRRDFDLSVEGSFALGGAVTGVILTASGVHHPLVAMAVATAAGAVVGATTAALHLVLRVPVLMAGLVMNMALFSVTLRVLGRPTVSVVGVDTIFSPFIDRPGRSADIASSIELAAIVVAVLVTLAVFLKSEIGLALRASGLSPLMVRSQGVDDRRLLVLSLMLANGLSALSGNLVTQVQGFPTSTSAPECSSPASAPYCSACSSSTRPAPRSFASSPPSASAACSTASCSSAPFASACPPATSEA